VLAINSVTSAGVATEKGTCTLAGAKAIGTRSSFTIATPFELTAGMSVSITVKTVSTAYTTGKLTPDIQLDNIAGQ
jgi:hypothetical protein